MIKPVNLYNYLKNQGLNPALLESNGVASHFSNKSILGCNFTQKLEVKNGILFHNEIAVGTALDIFNYFKLAKVKTFFPAWIGFFSYEFARYCGLPTKDSDSNMPEACFFLYDEGFVWVDKKLTEKPKRIILNEALNNEYIREVKLNCDFSEIQFKNGVLEIINKIKNGEVYQVNLSQRYNFTAEHINPLLAYNNLVKANPSPFMGIIGDKNWTIVSGSPERLFKYNEQIIETRPIAGTRPRGKSPEQEKIFESDLKTNRKELSEHSMLIDLLRNDLAKVSIPGSTFINEAFTVEYYSHVMHLVSEVKSKSTASLKEVFLSIFPGGTITGTPKESAMQSIAEIETVPRGAYTGSLGFISSGYGADFNILIRSLIFTKNAAYFTTGAGIVSESDPTKEYEEVEQKAKSIRYILHETAKGSDIKERKINTKWQPKTINKQYKLHIGFIENHDSFSFNIIDYFKILGCQVSIIDHHNEPNIELFSHLVLGPGPKNPQNSGNLMKWLNSAVNANMPTLGICLGHQAIGLYFGAELVKAKRAIHGEIDQIQHQQQTIFKNIPNFFKVARYHSLILKEIPDTLSVQAQNSNGEIMAIAHKSKPFFGVQFHPESFLSSHGILLFSNFLEQGINHATCQR